MKKKNKYVDIFKKLDDILKYSSVDDGMTKREEKKYHESNNALILDKPYYYGVRGGLGYSDLRTLIIDEINVKNNKIVVTECTAHEIYINNHKNLGGITIPYEFSIKNSINMSLIWNRKDRTIINKINIVFEDFITSIDANLIERIDLRARDGRLFVTIENYNSIIIYEINELGKINKKYEAIEVLKKDIKENSLDLRKFEKYKRIYFSENLKFDKLIINKDIIKNIRKYDNICNKLYFNKLELIDDDDMKLIPKNIIVDVKEKVLKYHYNKNQGYFLTIESEGKMDVVYINKDGQIVYLDDEYLKLKHDMIENRIFSEYYDEYTKYLIIIKDSKNYKVLIDEKIYEITDEFKKFILLNSDVYLNNETLNYVYNDEWFEVIGADNFKFDSFLGIYNDYLKFKDRLEKLKELGLSDDALKYLMDRRINSIINTEINEELIDINLLNKFEIDLYNKMGEEYIKVKKLKR